MKLFIVLMIILLSHGSEIANTTANGQFERNPSDAQKAIMKSLVDMFTAINERTDQTVLEKVFDLAKAAHHHMFKLAVESVCQDKNAEYPGMDEATVRTKLASYNMTGVTYSDFMANNPVRLESVSSGFTDGLKHCPQDIEAYNERNRID